VTAPPDVPTLPWVPGLEYGTVSAVVDLPGAPQGAFAAVVGSPPEAVGVEVTVVTGASGALVVRLSAAAPVDATFVLLVPTHDAVALWTPGSGTDRGSLPPSWGAAHDVRPLDGIALGCLVGRDDTAQLTFGVRTDHETVRLRAGLVEENAQFMVACDMTIDATGTDIVVNLRRTPFTHAVRALGETLGLHVPPRGHRHEEPVLCTWYSLHQNVDAATLEAEGRLASELGFRTMLIDDGWQTDDDDRGYTSCGTWVVEPSKIPDPAGLVTRLREHGLATMWWIGTPFLGNRSAARADGMPVLYDEPGMGASVLDPRSRRVREHLRNRLLTLVRTTGAAGLKLDFLERWADTPSTPPPADAVTASVPDAALSLLHELITGIAGIVADPLVEFREPYIGPRALQHATMLRVGDCPMSPRRNRIGITDLRLITHGIAVHADPVMWAPADSPERVAQHLHHAMFGVPQVSVRLAEMRADHRDVLAHWLATWRRVRPVLLHGELDVSGVTDGYREITAAAGGEAVTVQYTPVVSRPPDGAATWLLVNAHDADTVLVRCPPGTVADVDVTDCRGQPVSRSRISLGGLITLDVPPGGTAQLVLDLPPGMPR
jgi:alpha-galactosidase